MCWWLIREHQCTCWARRIFKLRWNGHFAEVQKPYNGSDRKWRSANKRGDTCVCSRCRSVRLRAITRRNGSISVAWWPLLRTRMFLRVEKRWKSTIDHTWEDTFRKMDNFAPLDVPQMSSSSNSSSTSTSRSKRISQNLLVYPKHQQIQWRPDVPSMHAESRCKPILTSKSRKAVA